MNYGDGCAVNGCGGRRKSLGWCENHYKRYLRHGDVAVVQRYSDPAAAFLARTEPLLWSGCLIWTAHRNAKGYGTMTVRGKKMLAHRFAWEQKNGPIPDGVEIDHRYHCDRACCETSHLREATRAENARNLSGGRRDSALPRGVYAHGDKYIARAGAHHLGVHPTVEEAALAAAAGRSEHWGEFAGKD